MHEEEAQGVEDVQASEGGTVPSADLESENKRLKEELSVLLAEKAAQEEKQKGLAHLKKLAGGSEGELYEAAVKKAEESPELAALPIEKRYELGYFLVLGEESDKHKGEKQVKAGAPVFAHSSGSGVSPAFAVKAPSTFEMARENAKKYFNNI